MTPNQVAQLSQGAPPCMFAAVFYVSEKDINAGSQCSQMFPAHLVLDQNHQSHRGFSNGCKYGDAACCPHIPSVQCFFVHNYTYTYLYMYIHDIIQLYI